MIRLNYLYKVTFVFLLLTVCISRIQSQNLNMKNNETMKTYLIERDIPDAGKLTAEDLKNISKKSCSVLKNMGPNIQWVQSYVTDNKIFCIYKAKNEELIREHGKEGGFPVTKITEISSTISPATAESK